MTHLTPSRLLRGALLVGLALTTASGWAQWPDQGQAKPAQGQGLSAFKLDAATIVCAKLPRQFGKHQVRVAMHGQVNQAELRLKLTNSPVAGSPWLMPNTTGFVSFTSPPVALAAGTSYTIETHDVGDPNTPAYHIRTAVAPDCRLVGQPPAKDTFMLQADKFQGPE